MSEDELAAQMPLPEVVSAAYAAEVFGGAHCVAQVMDLVETGDLFSPSHSIPRIPDCGPAVRVLHRTGVEKPLPMFSADLDPARVLIESTGVLWQWCVAAESLRTNGSLPPKERGEARLAALYQRADVLNSSKEAMRKQAVSSDQKPLSTTERNSLLKLVIGMAMKGYGYDPAKGKNKAVAEIAGDLSALGMQIDEDTVRRYLSEAKASVLPGKAR